MTYLWVMIGSALGGGRATGCPVLSPTHIGETFPWGTLIINVTGSFVIGFFATLTGPEGRVFVGGDSRQFFMTGICGGYTTFSSFSLQTLNLVRDGEWLWRAQCRRFGRRSAWSRSGSAISPPSPAELAQGSLIHAPCRRDAMLLRIFIGEDDKPPGPPAL